MDQIRTQVTEKHHTLSPLRLAALLALVMVTVLAGGAAAAEPAGEVPVTLHANIDRGVVTVGDQVVYTLEAEHPGDVKINFPNLPPEWGSLEVLSQQPDPVLTLVDDRILSSKQYTMTAFSVGEHGIQPLPVDYVLPGGQMGTLHTDPVSLTVQSVVTDTALLAEMDIAPLKPQAGVVRDMTGWFLLGAGIVAGLLALALLLLWLFVWRRRRAAGAVPVDNRLPEEIAYDELERIRGLSLPERNRIKEHYTLVTDCVRRYAERIYGIPVMDRTTWEFTRDLRKARADRLHITMFGDLFDEADLVKFAKFVPDMQEANTAVEKARHIVDVTRPHRAGPERADTESGGDVPKRMPAAGTGSRS